MTASTGIDLGSAVAAEFLALAEVLDGLPNAGWDTHRCARAGGCARLWRI